ncbi:unnamed protein product, partial [Adineta steineri]
MHLNYMLYFTFSLKKRLPATNNAKTVTVDVSNVLDEPSSIRSSPPSRTKSSATPGISGTFRSWSLHA